MSTAFAIPLALATTSAFNGGLIVEKRALSRMPPLELNRVAGTLRTLASSPTWLAGLSLMAAGLGCQVAVLALAPISVVQPVLASGVALTPLLSRLVLRERLGGRESWCVSIMVISLVLVALSQDPAAGRGAGSASGWLVAAVVLPTVLTGFLVSAPGGGGKPSGQHAAARDGRTGNALLAGTGVGLLYGVSAIATKGLSGDLGRHQPLAAVAGGILASPYLYLLGGCSVLALLLYQAALQACRASILVPVTNVVSSGYFVIVGSWLYHEQLPSSPVKLALRLAGFAAAVLVVIVLSRPPARPRPEAGTTSDLEPGTDPAAGAPRWPGAGAPPWPEAGEPPWPEAGEPPWPEAGLAPRPGPGTAPRPGPGTAPRPGPGTAPRPVLGTGPLRAIGGGHPRGRHRVPDAD